MTPVVFITNETLLQLDTAAVGPLAANIGGLVRQLLEQNRLPPAGEREAFSSCSYLRDFVKHR